jgi:hypothetical protein
MLSYYMMMSFSISSNELVLVEEIGVNGCCNNSKLNDLLAKLADPLACMSLSNTSQFVFEINSFDCQASNIRVSLNSFVVASSQVQEAGLFFSINKLLLQSSA